MSEFGALLRSYRRQCGFSQDKLGEFIGWECDDYGEDGVSGATISGWESGTQIKGSRRVYIALIKIFHKHGCLQTLDQANKFLKVADRRALDEDEAIEIFGEGYPEQSNPSNPSNPGAKEQAKPLARELLRQIKAEVQTYIQNLTSGESSAWANLLLRAIRWLFHRWTSKEVARAFTWIMVWFLTWKLTLPLTHWPFASQEQLCQITLMYAAGTVVLPLLIGAFTHTKSHAFWQQQEEGQHTKTHILRLYTHQGAIVGFNVGYATIFFLLLTLYYIRFWPVPSWIDSMVAIWPVALGYLGARHVPINLKKAFGRLDIREGGVFFIFVLVGPLWGVFFFFNHQIALAPVAGPITMLIAVWALAKTTDWQHQKTGRPVIQAHIWTAFYGAILVLIQIRAGASGFGIITLICILATMVVLLAHKRIHFTLGGSVGFALATGLLYLTLALHWLAGLATLIIVLLVWWRWGRQHIRLSMSFWEVIAAITIYSLALRQGYLELFPASLLMLVSTIIILWLDKRFSIDVTL